MASPRILVTRLLPGEALSLLSRRGRVDLNRDDRNLTPAELRSRIREADGLLCVPSDRIDAPVFRAATRLRGIANCAVGVDNIDLDEARRRGIPVTNTPGVLTDATADLTWALILAVTRRLVEGDRRIREGRFRGWSPTFMLGRSLRGRILGVLGLGRIGQAVARRAGAFGMRVVYHSRRRIRRDRERELSAQYLSLKRLLSLADVLTIHLPLTPKTRGLLGAREFSRMKAGAYIVNTARGEILDEQALVRSLRSGRMAGAGLDVYAREPRVPAALCRMEQVVLLPHLGSATVETREGMARMAAENLLVMIGGGEPPNRVV